MITITAIAIDPFTQQLVSTVDCNIALDSINATIPRTNYFDGAVDAHETPVDAKLAVLSGLFASDHLPQFECLTGNCTFAKSYATLGFCSACDKVTSQIQVEEICDETETHSNGSYYIVNVTSGDRCTYQPIINITRPAGSLTATWIATLGNRSMSEEVFNIDLVSHWLEVRDHWYRRRNVEIGRDILRLITKPKGPYGVLYSDDILKGEVPSGCDNPRNNSAIQYCKSLGAASCTIYPCVHEYEGSIHNGKLAEKQISQTRVDQEWGLTWNFNDSRFVIWLALLDMECVTEPDRQGLVQAGYDLSKNERWLGYQSSVPFNQGISPDAPFPQSLQAKGCMYTISRDILVKFWSDFLANLLLGTATPKVTDWIPHISNLSYDSFEEPSYDPNTIHLPEVLSMFKQGRFHMKQAKYVAAQLADTLTLYVRTNGNQNHSTPAYGQVIQNAVCIRVNWAWITLPAVLAVATVVFFGLTVVHVWRSGGPVWKSSPLALVFHGPGGSNWLGHHPRSAPSPEHEPHLGTIDAMEKVADTTLVKLSQSEYPPQLVLVGSKSQELHGTVVQRVRGLWAKHH
ncbi:hypothetical protein F4819DRAFT_482049 [Hypoxylon fuscum]|nr:hypothetical protein F4819DRAFT_482049 [Hypoxylon fuscum]